MTIIRFIGDVHGKWDSAYNTPYNAITTESPYPTIQVGDMGYGFYPYKDGKQLEKADVNHRFIRGNHDDVDVCENHPGFIKDGTVIDNMMFVGGAYSIDKACRTSGIDWWETEELSIPEFNRIVDIYDMVRPEIMVTHDCPDSVAGRMFKEVGQRIKTRTSDYFEYMLSIHTPKLWIFGHWHETRILYGEDTTFMCLGELEFADVDTELAMIVQYRW